jgi:hypothetical protein
MAIEGFEYEAFAENLSSQVGELLPKEFDEFKTNYVINTVKNFSKLAGEALYNDTESNFNAEQAMLITQIIAEWSFHKSIDLIRSGILPEYWDSVMQKIAFTIFEISKKAILQNINQDDLLQIVEHHVHKTYNEAIEELQANGIINEDVKELAEKQSNIDAMMEQMQAEKEQEIENQTENTQQADNGAKLLKLASVALLLQYVSKDKVTTILNKFNPQDAQTVIQYMQMPDLGQKVDKNIAIKCLSEIRTSLPEIKTLNPTKILIRLNNVFGKTERPKVEALVRNERINVKKFISAAYNGEFENVPLKVGSIIAQYLEESV